VIVHRHRRNPAVTPLTFFILLCALPVAAETPPNTQPFPGITFTQQILATPPLHLYWVQIDLTNPAVHLRVCPGGPPSAGGWETTLLPVSKIAEREKLDVAVNGSYFTPSQFKLLFGRKDPYFAGNPARASGWTVTDGRLWSSHPLSLEFPTLVLTTDGQVTIDNYLAPPPRAKEAVSGQALLLHDGKNVAVGSDDAPRTAAGLDAQGKTLTLFVADGRRPDYSVGLSMQETALYMLKLGCRTAISLDGGGSSTLVIRRGQHWSVVNTPSDGHDLPIPISVERPVDNALGVFVTP
jgi:hypothetical protein